MALDYRAFPILYVDSDSASLQAFRAASNEAFTCVTTESALGALQIMGSRDVAILVAEQQLPDMTGIELCRRVRELRPAATRLLTARELDLPTALDAINVGGISGYLPKPWQAEQLRAWLRAAIDPLQRERSVQSMEMRLWHGGQVAAATTIYEELVHELSNPLGALEINASLVSDLLDTALQEPDVPEQLRESLATAHEAHIDSLAAIDQMKGLVSRMRHERRPALSPARGRCDVASVVEATVRLVRAEIEKVAQLQVQLQATPSQAAMDASVLGQVLLNLLLNAAQAVRPETRVDNCIRVEAQERAGQLEVAVEDNGVGIAPEHLERVFEPFFTTKDNGTGLGLAIVRELISQSRGTIRVRNLAARGVRFELTIPSAKSD